MRDRVQPGAGTPGGVLLRRDAGTSAALGGGDGERVDLRRSYGGPG
jgi:hypothetical protein